MFGNNAFGALAMDQESSGVAGPSLIQVEGDEVEAEWLSLSKTNGEVYVKVQEPVDLADLPSECNLMAISNRWGLLAVGGQADVRIHRLKDIHGLMEDSPKDALPPATPVATIPLGLRPVWIRLGMNDERLVVGLKDGAGILVYKLAEVLSGATQPYHTFNPRINGDLLDLLPNPAPASPLAALIGRENMVIADIESRSLMPPIPGSFTSACWSAKGKQIVVGSLSGRLAQYTPEGALKAEIPPPPDLDGSHVPTSVQWLENDLFLVYYAHQDAEPEDPLECFVISRTKESITYTKFFDIMDSFGVGGRSGRYRHFATLKNWGSNTKHLAFVVSGLATEIVVLHGASERGGSKWELVTLGETARGVLPAAKKGMSDDDTSVLALDIDLTVEKPVERGMIGGEELPDLPPPPRLLAYSQSGFLISFNIVNAEGGQYPGKVVPSDISTASTPSGMDMATASSTPAPPEPTKPSFDFGSAAPTALGSTTPSTTPSKSAFGSSGFGQPSQPAFGSTSLGSTTPSTTTAKPAFGQSGFSGFGNTTTSTSSGAFGKTSAPSQQTAFGSSGFGQPSTPSAFGQSTFGKPAAGSSTAPAFGATGFSGFGQDARSSSGSALGQSAFGQSATPGTMGSAFGQASSGQGAKSEGQAGSAFGQSAFGLSAKPSTPSFGFGATSSASSAFGAKPSSTSFGFGTSPFGQKTEAKDESKDKSSGSTNLFSPASFGSGGSAVGQSAFGAKAYPSPSSETKSPFAGFGQKTGATSSAFGSFGAKSEKPTASYAEKDDFGMGGFASMLGDTAKTAGPSGLAPSPPGSPVLQGGRAGQVPGLDDSPPSSPPPPLTEPPVPSSSLASASASAFIKPATAFSGASTGVFGNPSANKQQPAAFGTSIPAAFSSPYGNKTSDGAPTGGSAFGQASKPAAPAFGTSTFGQPSKLGLASGSAFGQTSKPVGFGQSSTPNPAFGTISGGFGEFAKKFSSSGTPSAPSSGGFAGFGLKTSGSGGFGGFGDFASQSSGASIFGEKKSESTEKKATPAAAAEEPKSQAYDGNKDTKAERSLTTPGYDAPEPSQPSREDEDKGSKTEWLAEAQPAPQVESETQERGPVVPEVAIQPEEPQEQTKPLVDIGTASDVPLPPASPLDPTPADEISDPSAGPDDEPVIVERDEVPSDLEGEDREAGEEDEYDENDDYDEDDHEGHEGDEGQQEEDEGSRSEDYEDEGDEDEYSEEGEDDERRRRRSTSLAPEMSPINEEEGELESDVSQEDEDGPVPASKPPLKSPPTWFAKAAEPSLPVPSATEGTESGSLFGRMGQPSTSSQPSAAAQKLPPSFNLKHAVRTSSPLGQPPQMASTSPEGSPAKPFGFGSSTQADKSAVSAFGVGKAGTPFGLGLGRPPAQGASATAQAGPPSLFSGSGQWAPTATKAVESETGKTDAASKSPFAGFGQASTPSAPPSGPSIDSKASQPGSLFAGFGQKEEQAAAPAAPTSSLFAGFGQQKPADTLPFSSTQPGSLFGNVPSSSTAEDEAKEEKPQASGLFVGFGQLPAAKSPSAPSSTFGRKTETAPAVAPRPAAKGKFEPVPRASVPLPQQPTDDGKKTMMAVLERMIASLLSDLQHLKGTLASHGDYHKQFHDRSFPPVTLDNINEHMDLPFASLNQVTSIIQNLESRLNGLKSVEHGVEASIADIQSSLMKTDMKVGQAEQFLKARADGSFSRAMMQVKDLNPEQAEHRARLRKLTETVESTLIDLEDGIANLKKGLSNAESLQSEGSPSLGRIHKGVRRVEAGIRDRAAAIDDLANRIASLRVATPPRRRQSTYPLPERNGHAEIVPLSLEPSSGVIEAVEKVSERRAAIRARFSGKADGTAKVTKLDLSRAGTAPTRITSVPVPLSRPPAEEQPQSANGSNGSARRNDAPAPTSGGSGSFFTAQRPTGQAGSPFSFGSFGTPGAR